MILELQNHVSKDRNNNTINKDLRMLDCISGLGAIRGSVQDTCSTPEQTDWLKGTKEKADMLQKDLNRMLRRHICESAHLAASKDEYGILVALLGPGEGQESRMFAKQNPDLINRWATGAEHTGIEALKVREMVMEYIRCTLAVVHGGVEFSSYQPTRPLPLLGEEGDGEVALTARRSLRGFLFRR